MSNSERKANLPAIIKTAEPTFTELARRHQVPDFTFARESAFAMQILRDNPYLAEVACGNPDSLKEAIINVAAIGLSLSPIHNLAYLIPRKVRDVFKVCLDISYRGYIELGTSNGLLTWVKAEIVHDDDEFEYRGVNQEPVHKCNPFKKDRGNVIGGYVIAKMMKGDMLIDYMPIDEIYGIRDRSDGWKAYQAKKIRSTPWVTDEGQMIKKTLIRRGRKSWPSLVGRELDRAMDIAGEEEKIDFALETLPPVAPNPHRDEDLASILEFLETLERPEARFIEHLCTMTNRKIKALEDLTDLELTQAVTFLEGVAEAQAAKLNKKLKGKDIANENAD